LKKGKENSKLDIGQVLQKQGKILKFYRSQLTKQNSTRCGHRPSIKGYIWRGDGQILLNFALLIMNGKILEFYLAFEVFV